MSSATYEEQQTALKRKVKKRISDELFDRNEMPQWKLAELIGEGTSQVNRAINGETSPKSQMIRKKIFELFNIKDL